MKLAILFCFLCMFAAVAAQSAPLYRWVDAEGNIHYTDQPTSDAASNLAEKKVVTSTPAAPGVSYTLQTATRNFPVTLFTASCGESCTKAREHLIKRGVPFTERDASTPAAGEALTKLIGGLEVPVLVVGRSAPIKGYEMGQWNAALDAAGYPKSAPPGRSGKPAPEAKK